VCWAAGRSPGRVCICRGRTDSPFPPPPLLPLLQVATGGDLGLTSLAVSNGFLYVTYQAVNATSFGPGMVDCTDTGAVAGRNASLVRGCPTHGVLSRFPLSGADGLTLGAEEVLLNSTQRLCTQFETGGIDHVIFDGTGALYVSVGAGGEARGEGWSGRGVDGEWTGGVDGRGPPPPPPPPTPPPPPPPHPPTHAPTPSPPTPRRQLERGCHPGPRPVRRRPVRQRERVGRPPPRPRRLVVGRQDPHGDHDAALHGHGLRLRLLQPLAHGLEDGHCSECKDLCRGR
jgi:hypothetical protein